MQDGQQIEDTGSELSKFKNLGSEIKDNIIDINKYASEVNKTFGQTRERISEISGEIRNSIPE